MFYKWFRKLVASVVIDDIMRNGPIKQALDTNSEKGRCSFGDAEITDI